MRLAIVMKNLRQVFARHVQQVCPVVITSSNNHFLACVVVDTAEAIAGSDVEGIVRSGDSFDALVLANIKFVMLGNLSVILKSFEAIWFRVCRTERNVADLEQLRRGEKNHICRIMKYGVDKASLIDADDLEPSSLRLDRACKSSRSCAEYNHVGLHIGTSLQLRFRQRVWNELRGQLSVLGGLNTASGVEILARRKSGSAAKTSQDTAYDVDL